MWNKLWVHLDFICGVETQNKLHRLFRSIVSEWKKSSLIDGSILAYHFHIPRAPADSLYVCLAIPSFNLPSRSRYLPEAHERQLPEDVRNTVAELCSEYLTNSSLDRLERKDYEFELINGDAPSTYHASVAEILNFASKGTEIALEILSHDKTIRHTWGNDKEIGNTMMRLVNERLSTSNERHWGLHFACNSIFLSIALERYLRAILNQIIDGEGSEALGFLYEIERSGNFDEALRRFLPVVERYRTIF